MSRHAVLGPVIIAKYRVLGVSKLTGAVPAFPQLRNQLKGLGRQSLVLRPIPTEATQSEGPIIGSFRVSVLARQGLRGRFRQPGICSVLCCPGYRSRKL